MDHRLTTTLIFAPRPLPAALPPRPRPLPPARPPPRPALALALLAPLPPTTFTVTELFFADSPRFFAWACWRLVCADALRPAARLAVPAPFAVLVCALAAVRRPPAFFATILICTVFFWLEALPALFALNLKAPVFFFAGPLRAVPGFDLTTIFGLRAPTAAHHRAPHDRSQLVRGSK